MIRSFQGITDYITLLGLHEELLAFIKMLTRTQVQLIKSYEYIYNYL